MAAKKITTVVLPTSKPRNPFVEEAKSLHAGAHGPTGKAKRRKQRQNMSRHIDALLKGEKTEFEID